MASGRILIEFVTALVPILDALIHDCIQILNTGALDHHEILDKKAILGVPACMQDPRGRIQQIAQLLVVNLQKARLDIKLFLTLRHLLKKIANREEKEAVTRITLRPLS